MKSDETSLIKAFCGPDRKTMVIHDRIYDVQNFIKRHPGGSVIRYLINQDATDAYDGFHLRSKVVDKYLKNLPSLSLSEYFVLRKSHQASCLQEKEDDCPTAPSTPDSIRPCAVVKSATRPPTPGDLDTHKEFDSALESTRTCEVLSKYRKFRQELEDEGYFDPSYFLVSYRCIEVALMFVLHFYMLYTSFSPVGQINWARMISAIIIGGLAGGRAGWLQHEGGHASLTGNIKVDRVIQKIGIGFGLMCYDGKWNNMHNKHHAVPQKEDQDPDLDTLPFLATYEQILFRGRRRHLIGAMKWWLKYQHFSFFVLTSVINVFFWHLYLHPREYIFRKPGFDTLFLVLSRYAVHFAVVYPFQGISGSLIILFATMFVSGIYLFGNFSLNHTFMPTLQTSINKNWVDQQMDHTLNITCSIPVNWWMGYLNCQIEHHLFPNMPQFRQPGITKRTKKFCESVGIAYTTIGYFEAVHNVFKNLREISFRVDAHSDHYKKQPTSTRETYNNDSLRNEKVECTLRSRAKVIASEENPHKAAINLCEMVKPGRQA